MAHPTKRLFVHYFPIELEFRTIFDLVEGEKQENTEKTLGARRELKANSTQVWHMFHDSYPDHIVGNECFFQCVIPAFQMCPAVSR